MTMHPLLHQLSASPCAVGLELTGSGDALCANMVLVRKRRQQVEVEKHALNLTEIAAIQKAIPQGVPVVVVLSGKGVLHRFVNSSTTDAATLLHKVLPNANAADFRVQQVAAAGGQHLVSVVRWPVALEQLEPLRAAGLPIVACSLGAAAAAEVLPFILPSAGSQLQAGTHRISWSDGLPAGLEQTEAPETERVVELGGKTIPAAAIPAVAAAMQFLIGGGTARIVSEELTVAAGDFSQRRLFRTGGLTLLAVTLVLLIGNYLAFSHYWDKKAQLEEALQVNGGQLDRVRELNKQVATRRSFLAQTGLQQAGRHSFYADRIAAGLPDALQLTRMAIAPRERTTVEDSIAFRPGVLVLEGECAQSVLLNDWINRLSNEPWIAKASLRSYVQPSSRKTGLFEIEIQLSE